VTLSGRPGRVVSGGEVPILTSSGQGAPNVAYKQFGTVVNFLPIVMNGKIHLEVRPELSAINQANGITIQGVVPTVVPGFSTRSAECAVELEDGQTLAIGGLIQNTVNSTIQRVPIVGQIPGLAMFFTNKSYNEIEEELLIIVTPRLVDGFDCTRIPKYLPGRETRSPDDFELFLEGIMEAPRGPRTLAPHLRDYKGAHMSSPNIGQIPCGNGGGIGGVNGCSTCAPRGPVTGALSPMPQADGMPIVGGTVPAAGELPMSRPLPVGEPNNGLPPVELPSPIVPTPVVPMSAPTEPRPSLPPVSIGPGLGGSER
jgi:pilus assembly protein CpaC